MQYPSGGAGTSEDQPWYTTEAVAFLDAFVKPETRVLEFGAGRSTVWLAKRTNHLVSVETDPEWFAWVSDNVKNADLRRLDPPADHGACDGFPDAHFDLVIVDGHDASRVECARKSVRILKPGGYLMLDNAERTFHRPTMRKCGQDYSEILDFVDGWELWFTHERPMVQHGNWYTVWWQKP